jgi:hypothetical protein
MHTLPSLAFGFRSCSDKWKQAPQRKYLNNSAEAKTVWRSGRKIRKAIGFGVDELYRAIPYSDDKYENWYPLIEWGWNRNDCKEAIRRADLPLPPKSACFFCPATHKSEIKQLAQTAPDLYGRALAMERNASIVTKISGLGRSFSWKDMAGPDVVEQVCICFDGE